MLTIEMIAEAAERLQDVVIRTPLLESPLLNNALGFRLLIKSECLQKTGSFKIRGAYNKIASLDEDQRKAGVVAYSSGNHAQGVAAAANAMGVAAKIVMPADAPRIKLDNTAQWGAEVITYDRQTGDRAQIARDIAARTGATLVPPYDDYHLMAGQGTAGLEIAEQLDELGVRADRVICPVGGGGLIAGLSTAMLARHADTEIWAAEPRNFDDTKRSLAAGTALSIEPGHSSICDSIVTARPGQLTFPINLKTLSGGYSVNEPDVVAAMRLLFTELKVVAEPGGAVSVAAALSNKPALQGQTVVALVSGGNVDMDSFLGWMA